MKFTKTNIFILILIALLFLAVIILLSRAMNGNSKEKQNLGIVLFSQKDIKNEFEKSSGQAANFYDLIRAGLDAKREKEYDVSIKYFNQALPEVKLGPEVAIVHYELAQIYMEQGDLRLELLSREQIIKYTANPQIRQESSDRAEKIRFLLSNSPVNRKPDAGAR